MPTLDRSALRERWGKTLTAGANCTPSEAVLLELSEHYGISMDEARLRCEKSTEFSKQEWFDGDRTSDDGLTEFWNRRSPVFGITMSHAKQFEGAHPASSIEIGLALQDTVPGTLLDIGAGPGTNALFFAELGWDVTLSDVSTVMLDFAKARATRRGIAATFIDTRDERLPDGKFDVVMAMELLHLVADIDGLLKQIHDAMRPGGTLFFNIYAPPRGPDTYSYLYDSNWPILRKVRRAGFAKHPKVAHFYRYTKVERGALDTFMVSVADTVRYNRYVTMVGNRVRALRASRRAPSR